MAEDVDTGASWGFAAAGMTALAPFAPYIALAGFAFGSAAKKKREKKEAKEREQKANTMLSQAYERGRITRKRAGEVGGKYEGGNVSRASGSGVAVGGGVVREGIYQSSAMLAGLPADHKMRNPAMFGRV